MVTVIRDVAWILAIWFAIPTVTVLVVMPAGWLLARLLAGSEPQQRASDERQVSAALWPTSTRTVSAAPVRQPAYNDRASLRLIRGEGRSQTPTRRDHV